MIVHGDCLDVMAGMESESVDAVVTDPPYGLGFMGKAWDHGAPGVPFWREMLRVARPSSYLLAFGGTRTVHRIATSIEDAGWIIRDMLVWAYASGFPKSKASLKPAWEPIVMARKPGPLRMLAVDACRIGTDTERGDRYNGKPSLGGNGEVAYAGRMTEPWTVPAGRWPANVILTDPIFDGGVDGVVGGGIALGPGGPGRLTSYDSEGVTGWKAGGAQGPVYPGEAGTYSRFFLIPKADRTDREPVLGAEVSQDVSPRIESAHSTVCAKCGRQRVNVPGAACKCPDPEWVRKPQTARANIHPTVKPTELMRHLVRLVTPSGGTVLDPFLGSGTTGLACELEGFPWIGIEKEAEYVAIAEARLNGTQRGLGLAG